MLAQRSTVPYATVVQSEKLIRDGECCKASTV